MSRGHGHTLDVLPREGCEWVLAKGMRRTVPYAVGGISGQKGGFLRMRKLNEKEVKCKRQRKGEVTVYK